MIAHTPVLQKKEAALGCSGLFPLPEGFVGFLFVLKLNDSTWLDCMGNDFYIPIPSASGYKSQSRQDQHESLEQKDSPAKVESSEEHAEDNQEVSAYTDEIINEIRQLLTGISSEKNRKTKSKEAKESILQEIEKLAAEAYSIFRTSIPENTMSEVVELEPPVKICSGTGSGFEILCQGFNWESHKSGRWYMELHEKAAELASLGFTVVWLPPPTESISPEGYMPKDLYNLNSR